MYDDVTVYAFVRWCRDRLRAMLGRGERGGSPAGRVGQEHRTARDRGLVRLVYGIARHPATRACVLPLDIIVFASRSLYERRLRGRVLVMDRYFYDSLADLATDGRLAWLYIALVLWLLPRPRVPIFVEVDAETAYARKREYALDYMRWRRSVYRRIFAAVPDAVFIENYDKGAALRALEAALDSRLDRSPISDEQATWSDSGTRR